MLVLVNVLCQKKCQDAPALSQMVAGMARSAAANDSMARLRLPGVVAAASPTCRAERLSTLKPYCKNPPSALHASLLGVASAASPTCRTRRRPFLQDLRKLASITHACHIIPHQPCTLPMRCCALLTNPSLRADAVAAGRLQWWTTQTRVVTGIWCACQAQRLQG